MSYDKYHIDRCEALEFLHAEVGFWPDCVPDGGPTSNVGEAIFRSWRFILSLGGELLFANCLSDPIRKRDFLDFIARYAPMLTGERE
jgi:hypothetical protein